MHVHRTRLCSMQTTQIHEVNQSILIFFLGGVGGGGGGGGGEGVYLEQHIILSAFNHVILWQCILLTKFMATAVLAYARNFQFIFSF